MRDIRTLEEILHTRTPIVIIESHEENKAIRLLERLANLNDRSLFTWSVTQGLRLYSNTDSIYNTREFADALRHIEASPANAVYVFLDAHPYFEDPIALRTVKNIALKTEAVPRLMVFVSSTLETPPELSRFVARYSPPLPDKSTIMQLLKEEIGQWLNGEKLRGERAALDLLIQHLSGLTESEARRLIRMAIRDDGAITMSDIHKILKAKHEFLDVEDVLSIVPTIESLHDIGGLAKLKRWLSVRKQVFLQGDPHDTLPAPKGMLLLGVQGAGKSLAAKAVASAWGLPLFRLDFGALYNKYHGETERNLRNVLAMSAAMSPCVLWMDEIEKGISVDSGDSDGGVSRRVLGTLLTWMAERQERVFLVATSNDISRLPPELLRKGRFDETFFVDLPNQQAREEILRIHLTKRKQNVQAFNLVKLAESCEGFSGAEIEQAILAALYEAHAAKTPLHDNILTLEFGRTKPLSVLAAEKVSALREWASERAVPAD